MRSNHIEAGFVVILAIVAIDNLLTVIDFLIMYQQQKKYSALLGANAKKTGK